MAHYETPVLIVGGAGFGLANAIFLSNNGVDSMLVERYATPAPMPKARYLNQRTMEVFRQHNLADAIYQCSIPLKYMSTTRWSTSLGGDGPTDRKLLYEMDVFGGGSLAAQYRANSPCESTIYPQVRLEPLMRAHAASLLRPKLLFNYLLTAFEQDAHGVTATIQDRGSGELHTVRAQYLIGADAGKTVGPIIGVKYAGTPELVDMVTMYFRADLSKYLDSDNFFANWFANPEGDTGSWGTGVLGKLGPNRFDRYCEEWMFHFSFKSDDPARFDEAALIPQMRALLKLPELEPEVLAIGHWIVQGVLADKYRFGRVFIGGDAAHRHTPTTGLGLNSAIHDAHNLAWKLALVLKGKAGDALLDSYETERRPEGQRNVDWALFTFSNHQLTGAAIGITPGDLERSRSNFNALLAQNEDGQARRHRFAQVMKLHNTEYQANDLEIGIRYEAGALLADDTPSAPRDPTGCHYVPTTRPGARLPHAWLQRAGQKLSTHDLVPPNGFVLICGPTGRTWAQAAAAAATRFGIHIDVVLIADASADASADTDPLTVADCDGAWRAVRAISDDGALLIRPDQIVAWRAASSSLNSSSSALAQFEAALRIILKPPDPT